MTKCGGVGLQDRLFEGEEAEVEVEDEEGEGGQMMTIRPGGRRRGAIQMVWGC